ncbi:endonuclease/exonuclease/phosphatase family protein [Psychrosphaera sp. 1_MG-2023]|uniref:endonuclease/exonuclease/phosphatase family protein n=1 Tax=Psychrosphaera sp. 1_MG-2023 TaxID=3062643 RepID=UPI0026E206B4|nr:endonuclease/exonuclease/phosphatase family protein [Psychrosphaera sp. 1_MG-2023]MDO6720768.1 endonuclease/exonuclease/phosphatase family protein [Psychrosphaera sp. 1_MG-2023]
MRFFYLIFVFLLLALLSACGTGQHFKNIEQGTSPINTSTPITLKVATFNVSMEATNYVENNQKAMSNAALRTALKSGEHPQIKNIAEIVQRVAPDIILLNEFDYIADKQQGIALFKQKYLEVSQRGQQPIRYPFVYLAPVNTGMKTPFHQDKKNRLSHFGFGKYEGQYGMVLLSKYPIGPTEVRTFQHFLWKDMPNHLMPKETDGNHWYRKNEVELMRLSSKSHWDIPVMVCGQTVRVLASHPTPPVFDGPEDRNGRRNHDELRFWADYINNSSTSYHYDDNGTKGGIPDNSPFIILGDLNASPVEGDAFPGAISQLLTHPKVNSKIIPESEGGVLNRNASEFAANHTASWGIRADYVLPSIDFNVISSGVFWPKPQSPLSRLVSTREASSDHRLVWVTLQLPVKTNDCISKD